LTLWQFSDAVQVTCTHSKFDTRLVQHVPVDSQLSLALAARTQQTSAWLTHSHFTNTISWSTFGLSNRNHEWFLFFSPWHSGDNLPGDW